MTFVLRNYFILLYMKFFLYMNVIFFGYTLVIQAVVCLGKLTVTYVNVIYWRENATRGAVYGFFNSA